MAFKDWLLEEAKKADLSFAEIARRGSFSHARISQIMNESSNPGLKLCRDLARALRIPPEIVFRQAGLLPPQPESTEQTEKLLFYFDQLSPDHQRTLLIQTRALAETKEPYIINKK